MEKERSRAMNRFRLGLSNAALGFLLAGVAFSSQAAQGGGGLQAEECVCNVVGYASPNLTTIDYLITQGCPGEPEPCEGGCVAVFIYRWTGEGRWEIVAGKGTEILGVSFDPLTNEVIAEARGQCKMGIPIELK
jgi:hypothetical protein